MSDDSFINLITAKIHWKNAIQNDHDAGIRRNIFTVADPGKAGI